MARSFLLTGKVKRTFLDEITLQIEASSELEAYGKAQRILESYPDKHYEEGASYVFVENRETLNSEVVDISQKKDRGVA